MVRSLGLKTLWSKLTRDVPSGFLAALLLGAAFLVFVAWDQSHWWAQKEDYSFGWLVPLFTAYVIHDRWAAIKAAVGACAAPGSGRAAGAARWVFRGLLTACLLFGALLFLIGAFYRAGAGPSYPGTLAITMGTAGLLTALLLANAPETVAPAPAGLAGDARVRLAVLFTFPVLIWFVSAPMVSVIENNLSTFLLHQIVTVVSFVFDVLGMPVEQQGNVLVLPTGRVGVAEACSGIRSLTACLFAGSFLAAVFLRPFWKKVLLVAMAMLLAFFTNLLRGLFLTAYAYNYGPEAMEGTVHDAAGYAVLGLTVVGLLCLLPLLNLRLVSEPEEPTPGDSSET